MFQVDTDDIVDSLDGISGDSLQESSECSGLFLNIAAVTSISKWFVAYANAGSKVGKTSKLDLPSSSDGKQSTNLSSGHSIHLASRTSIVVQRKYSLSEIPECVVADDYRDSKSTSTTTQSTYASYDEVFRYSHTSCYEDDHMYEKESVPTVSYSPKSWRSAFELSNNNVNYSGSDTINDEGKMHCDASYRGARQRGKISKVSTRILELPREVAFNSSFDNSIDEGG